MTRRGSMVQNPAVKSVGNFSTRFSLPSFLKRVRKLTDSQKDAISRTGFGKLLLIPTQMLSKNLLVELMERWDIKKRAFVLRPGEITTSLLDVALILGLRVTGNPVLLREDTPFLDLEREYSVSLWNRKITVASLEQRLDSLAETTNEDFVRSFLLYMFGTFLFPNTNGKIDSRYVYLLRDMDKVNSFAWGAAVLADVFHWLYKRKKEKVQYVGGCLIFLQIIWNLELTSDESNSDIIKELLEAEKRTWPGMNPQSSEDTSSHIDHTVKSGFQSMGRLIVDLEAVSETENYRVAHRVQTLSSDESLPETVSRSSACHYLGKENELSEHPQISGADVAIVISSDDDWEDDLQKKSQTLEEQIVHLKNKIGELTRENKILKTQLFSSLKFEEQNKKLKDEIENLRQENEESCVSTNSLVTRLVKLVFDEITDT